MSEANEAKKKALQLTLDKLDKTYGRGAVMKLGDEAVEEIEAISSGSIGLDLALGVGGYPRGRVIEIYGPESSGKTDPSPRPTEFQRCLCRPTNLYQVTYHNCVTELKNRPRVNQSDLHNLKIEHFRHRNAISNFILCSTTSSFN